MSKFWKDFKMLLIGLRNGAALDLLVLELFFLGTNNFWLSLSRTRLFTWLTIPSLIISKVMLLVPNLDLLIYQLAN